MTGEMSVQEWDEVLITGHAYSPIYHFVDLLCTVATVVPEAAEDRYGDFQPATIKVWPDADQPDPDGSGKIWFRWSEVESATVLYRPTDEEEQR